VEVEVGLVKLAELMAEDSVVMELALLLQDLL
jgi:hypothetical protein